MKRKIPLQDSKPLSKQSYILYLQEKGQLAYDTDFKLTSRMIKTLLRLYPYIFNRENDAKNNGLNLNKGLFIQGKRESGKTTLMFLIRSIISHRNQFKFKSCLEIEHLFFKYNIDPIDHLLQFDTKNWCFDDFGARNSAKHVQILNFLSAYFFNDAPHGNLHIVSNFTKKEIISYFGTDFYQKIVENFNIITIE